MKTIAQISSLILVLALCSGSVFAQSKYGELKAEKDGVQIYGTWKKSKCFKKDSPKMLCLTAINTSEKNMNCSYTIAFYDGPTMEEESPKQDICIKAGKKLKGRNKGMCLLPNEISNDQIMTDDFAWEIEGLELKTVEDCE